MRIPSNPTLENLIFRPIPVCDASAPWPSRDLNSKGLKVTDGKGRCLWGVQHWRELLSQSEVLARTVKQARQRDARHRASVESEQFTPC